MGAGGSGETAWKLCAEVQSLGLKEISESLD